jgi:hypothetical protein
MDILDVAEKIDGHVEEIKDRANGGCEESRKVIQFVQMAAQDSSGGFCVLALSAIDDYFRKYKETQQ